MMDSESALQMPFAVIFSIRLLCISLILETINNGLHWSELISLMPSRTDSLSQFSMLLCTNLITICLTIWLICKIKLGNNWARSVLFLGFIIMIPLTIPDLIEMVYYSWLYIFVSAFTLLLQFSALSLLFSNEGNAWFRTQKSIKKMDFDGNTP